VATAHRPARPPVGFFEAQRRLRRHTALLIAIELLLVWLLGNLLVLPVHRPHLDVQVMLVVALVIALLLLAAVALARRRAVDAPALEPADQPEHAILREVVAQMAIASGSPVPTILVVDDDALNAYAVSTRHGGALVCTTGLVRTLDRRELTGVVAHEMAHLRNRDSTVVWTASFAVGLVVALAAVALLYSERGADRRAPIDPATGAPRRALTLRELDQEARDRSGLRMLAVGFAMAMWLVARPAALLVRAAISRRREQLADASAVQYTRDPTGLRSALEKIAASDTTLHSGGFVTASLWIDTTTEPGVGGWWARLLDSHPPIEQRIAWLRSLERTGELWADFASA